MSSKLSLFFIILLTFFSKEQLSAQEDIRKVIGYCYESNQRGYLENVEVHISSTSDSIVYQVRTDLNGKFEIDLPIGRLYLLTANKKIFVEVKDSLDMSDSSDNRPIFLKYPMDRLPGYLLEASITEFISDSDSTGSNFSLEGVTIEVYNNTVFEEVLRLEKHNQHTFSILLEQGNEYIFMLRKEGYFTKRMRANVNVNGCILCLEGFGTVSPGVAESLTKNNTMGTMVGNVNLKKVLVGKTVEVKDIYYDYGSATIRKDSKEELDALAEMMKDNPRIEIELASHTDCRGSKLVNQRLSQERAESVVRYILNKVKIQKSRIKAKGYGEEQPVNSCVDGIECSEEMHQQNRRTEFTVINITPQDAFKDRSLASIMQEENMDKIVAANEETYFKETTADSSNSKNKGNNNIIAPSVIPMGYEGYKIELMSQMESPDLNHPIFKAFNPVYLDISPTGRISFLIGDFKSRESAERWRKRQLNNYPKARVVFYKDGIKQ